MKPRGRERAENWLLIKEHDAAERPGADASVLEVTPGPPRRPVPRKAKPAAVTRAETVAAPKSRPGIAVAQKPEAAPRPPRAGLRQSPTRRGRRCRRSRSRSLPPWSRNRRKAPPGSAR
ncbi:hypothetical protein ACFQU2_11090 [Siccirubricoccus deserti]